jgi:hypothetical protein
LIEALGGRHPFEDLADEAAIEARLAHAFVPSEMSRWLREVLEKATHPTPELRFQSARDFAEAISGGHVPHVFDGTRIRAEALAGRAEVALARRKWRDAEKLAAYALEMSADCVTALLVVGRCQLARRRTERAAECFAKAVAISPRTPVQRELGWIALEQGPEVLLLDRSLRGWGGSCPHADPGQGSGRLLPEQPPPVPTPWGRPPARRVRG